MYVEIDGSVTELSVNAADNDILDASEYGIWLGGLGEVGSADIDLGGGGQSEGGNRVVGSGVAEARVDGLSVTAQGNWWGNADGPRVEELNGGTLDVEPFLKSDPRP